MTDETNGSGAGERGCNHPCQGCWNGCHHTSEGEVESLVLTIAQALNRHALARPYGETAAWCVCLTWSIDRTEDRAADERAYEVHVATHVAAAIAGAARESAAATRARAEERERIAKAIEARRVPRRRDNTQGQIDTREALDLAACIARGDA